MRDDIRVAGIYKILNKINGKFYIGSSRYIKHRWSTHKRFLNNNNHDNSYLQAAWNKYGENAFELIILEQIIDFNILEEREQYWIDHLGANDRELGYNLRLEANNNKGINKKSGYIHTLEAREKIREAATGRMHSIKTREKLSAWQKGIVPFKATFQAAKINRKEWKWPHEKGVKCKCEECKRKWNDYLKEWRQRKKDNIFIEGNQR